MRAVERVCREEAEALWRDAHRHVPAAWERRSLSAEWSAAVEAQRHERLGPAEQLQEVGRFHLPEPFAGRAGRATDPVALAVGVNPSVDMDEDTPRLGLDIVEDREAYWRYYWSRFARRNEAGRPVKVIHTTKQTEVLTHYAKVESMLESAFGPSALSGSVLYIDALPWKAKRLNLLQVSDEVAERVTRERVGRFVKGLTLGTGADDPLIITFGKEVATWLNAKWNPWELQVQRLRVGRTPVRVICMYHPGGSHWDAKAFDAAPGTPYRLAAAGLVAASSARPGR